MSNNIYNILRVVEQDIFYKVYFEVWDDGMNNGERIWMTSNDFDNPLGALVEEWVNNGGEIESV
jgi:hypothetical protein